MRTERGRTEEGSGLGRLDVLGDVGDGLGAERDELGVTCVAHEPRQRPFLVEHDEKVEERRTAVPRDAVDGLLLARHEVAAHAALAFRAVAAMPSTADAVAHLPARLGLGHLEDVSQDLMTWTAREARREELVDDDRVLQEATKRSAGGSAARPAAEEALQAVDGTKPAAEGALQDRRRYEREQRRV